MKKAIALAIVSTLMVGPAVYGADTLRTVGTTVPAAVSSPARDVSQGAASAAAVTTAAGDYDLTKAIYRVKQLFGDTEDYKTFTSYPYTNGGFTQYRLYWSDSTKKNPNLNVTVGSDGGIYSYSRNKAGSDAGFVITSVTKKDALDKAYSEALRINPEFASTLSKDYAEVNYGSSGIFTVKFYSYVNGYRIDNNYVTVGLDKDGGLVNFNRNMPNNAVLPDKAALLDENAIINSFNANLPFRLVYRTFYPDGYGSGKNAEVKLVYEPNSKYYSTAIDALTGSELTMEYNYNVYGASKGASDAAMAGAVTTSAELTKAETENVAMLEKFITAEQAAQIIYNTSELSMTGTYKLVSSNLYKQNSQYTGTPSYYWSLSFEDGKNANANATVDAETGKIKTFYCYADNQNRKYIYKDSECLTAAKAFITKYYPEIAGEYQIDKSCVDRIYDTNNKVESYYYKFNRIINGVPFDSDYINISVDSDTFKVTNVSVRYSDASFPPPENIIKADAATVSYWEKTDPTPYYIVADEVKDGKIEVSTNIILYGEKQLLLVYKYSDYCYIDAFTGRAINYSGTEYTKNTVGYFKPQGFGDIANNQYKDQINSLANMGIINFADAYNPTAAIKKGDFLNMLNSISGGYYTYSYSDKTVAAGSEVAVSAVRPVPVDSDDDNNVPLTRENTIRIIIDRMGYGKIAALKGIFVCDYADASEISEGGVGYVSIAKALGLLDIFGDRLKPSEYMNRGEAAGIVYSYLLYLSNNK